MWFEQVKEWLTWFFGLPTIVAGVSVGSAIIFLSVLFAKTSFGKRVYLKANKKVEELKGLHDQYKKLAEEKCDELKSYYEEKLEIVNHEKERLEKLLLAISDNINNVKVKEIVSKYKEESTKIVAITDVIKDKVEETEEKVAKEVDTIISKYQKEFDEKKIELDEEIAKYKHLIDEVKEDVEDSEISKE